MAFQGFAGAVASGRTVSECREGPSDVQFHFGQRNALAFPNINVSECGRIFPLDTA